MRTALLSAVAGLVAAVVPFDATAQVAAAAPREDAPIEIMRDTDTAMTCPQISEDAARLSEQMGGAPGGGFLSAIGGVAQAGAAMVIPGAGLVMAGADALTRPDRERKEAQASAVRHRWYYLNGLYAGQDCQAAGDAGGPTPATPADAAPALRR